MKKLTIVGAQINFLVGDINGNAKKIIAESKRAAEKNNADIIVFPELALSGYPPEDLLFRPGFYTRCHKALQQICEATKTLKTLLIVGHPEKSDDKNYNMASVIHKGKIQHQYAKQDLPNYEVFDEKRYFSAKHSPCVFDVKGTTIGLVICEDLWHSGPAKQAVEQGATLLITINASPYDRNKVRARENMLSERVHDIHVPVIYVNLVGGQDEIVFDGGSMVIDENKNRCQQAAYFKEDRMVVEIDTDDKTIHVKPKPLPARLSEENTLYEALTLGVRDYIKKNHFPGAIIGLSGGIDSALTLAIACDAIGAKNIEAVMMPSRFTSDISIQDAAEQAEKLGVKHHVIDIEPMYKAFLKSLQPLFAEAAPDATEENLQARIRGNLLMALSNKFGKIVLTTGNKSEMSVGYATLYGDMAGGFCVLKDIPKTYVYRLAECRNLKSDVIPQRVITREPSAELAEDQKDQDSLPPYPVLDEILELYIEKDEDPHNMYKMGLDKATVNRVIRMIDRNEYKRRQAPIGIRTTQRAFGKDRRYPITSGYTKNID